MPKPAQNPSVNSSPAVSGVHKRTIFQKETAILGNVAQIFEQDYSDDEDIDMEYEEMKRKFHKSVFTVYPDSKLFTIWNILTYFFVLLELATIPFYIGFEVRLNTTMTILQIAGELFFLADIVLKMNTGFYDQGSLIMNR